MKSLYNRIKVFFIKLFVKNYHPKPELYNSIYTCPMYCWRFLVKDDNLAFLQKSALHMDHREVKMIPVQQGYYMDGYRAVIDDFFTCFGLSESVERMVEIKLRIHEYMCDLLATGKFIYRTKYKLEQIRLDDFLRNEAKKEGVDIDEMIGVVSMKKTIDLKEISVYDFYTTYNTICKYGKAD